MALSGAEPVRAETLDRFERTFAAYGFRAEAFSPCFGQAEATLAVTGVYERKKPRRISASGEELQHGRLVRAAPDAADTRWLVSCGAAELGIDLRVVRSETLTPCDAGEIGEIWVAGPNVAAGYWRRTEETQGTFQARLANGEGPFLRTGDMGFLIGGELYFTGRLKDLIIIAGVNHHPHDLEWTVEQCHGQVIPSGCAAFSVEGDGREEIVVVAETQRGADHQALMKAIREAIQENHGLDVYAVTLIRKGSLLRTSSGKVRRRDCCAAFLGGRLEIETEYRRPRRPLVPPPQTPAESVERSDIEAWLKRRLSELLECSPDAISAEAQFASLGLQSVDAVALAGELEEWLARELPHSLIYEFPSVGRLAAHLSFEDESQLGSPALPAGGAAPQEAIAIVGMACRFPGASTPQEFWELLEEGRDAVGRVPAGRWTGSSTNAEGWGAFLEQVDEFDAAFFGITPREAALIDPQQRLTLELAWEALESAGRNPGGLAGSRTGVFIGVSGSDYARMLSQDPAFHTAHAGPGTSLSIAANRISYSLDLRGPSLAVDTACSSSLTALHLAAESLRSGESSLALAGGVNLLLTPELSRVFADARMLSPDGRCKTFDESADGYVRGEGCAVVVLQRLSDALRERSPVWALIRGTAVNQDGRSNGITAPNPAAQRQVIQAALNRSGVDA